MAQAQIKTETVKTHTVVLELSTDEALVIKALTGMVGGYSAQRDAANGVYDGIAKALSEIGVDHATYKRNHRFFIDGPSQITFANKEPNSAGSLM